MDSLPNTRFRFGSFLLDPLTGELSRDGIPLKLRPQAFKVLQTLVERPGELVTREELIRLLWGNDTFVDFDQGLNFCIREIRKHLGDGADEPRYVQTLARRGYRFIASVELIENQRPATERVAVEEVPPRADIATPPRSPAQPIASKEKLREPRRRSGLWVAVAAVLCVSIAFAGWWWRAGRTQRYPARIVILPFSNLTGNPNQDYLVRGVVEEITAQLGSIDAGSLAVIGRTSAEAVANKGLRVDQIATELDVDYLVEGSVRQQGDLLRITAQLIRTKDMSHVWASSYDREAMKLFTVEQQVAASVVREINLALGRAAKSNMPRRESANAEAMDEYLRGRDAMNRYLLTITGIVYDKAFAEDYSVAEAHLHHAIDLDPQFALAYADLGNLLSLRTGISELQGNPDWEGAESYALKALQIEPSLPETHLLLARVAIFGSGNLQDAKRSLDRALELNPSNPQTLNSLVTYHLVSGNASAAVPIAESLAKLEPMDLRVQQSLANVYYQNERYDEVLPRARAVLDKNPSNFAMLMTLSHTCFLKGDTACWMDTYLKTLEASANSDPSDINTTKLTNAKRVYREGGPPALATYIHGQGRKDFVSAADRNPAMRMLMLGETSAAIDLLEKLAADVRNLRSLRLIGYDPLLKPLRDDPRGRAVLASIRPQ